jgi:hypothetical protein
MYRFKKQTWLTAGLLLTLTACGGGGGGGVSDDVAGSVQRVNIVDTWDYEISPSGCPGQKEYGTATWTSHSDGYGLSTQSMNRLNLDTCSYIGSFTTNDGGEHYLAGNPISESEFQEGLNTYDNGVRWSNTNFETSDKIVLNGAGVGNGLNAEVVFTRQNSSDNTSSNSGAVGYDGFAITSNQVAYGSDYSQACKDEFGSGATIADWTQLESYYSTTTDIAAFVSGTGFDTKRSAWVTNNTVTSYSSTRDYFASYHNHSKPSGYLAHDNIDNYFISLGSWYGSYYALCDV